MYEIYLEKIYGMVLAMSTKVNIGWLVEDIIICGEGDEDDGQGGGW